MTTETPTIYKIPAVNFPRLEAEVAKMNRKAERLETAPVKLETHGQEVHTLEDGLLGSEYTETYFLCTIEGDAPQLEGYILVAEIRPVEDDDENVIREVPGQRCPKQFRTTAMDCDHCQKKARRKSIFIVKNEFGEFVRVGRTCLQDYLGGTNPESLIKRAEYMMDFERLAKDASDPEWGKQAITKSAPLAVPINRFVIACAVIIRKLGWVSKTQAWEQGGARSTASIAWDICVNHHLPAVREMVEKEELKASGKESLEAAQAIEWAEGIDPENAKNTYLHDLGVCCRQAYVTWDRAGYVGSLINAYRRHLSDLEAEKNAAIESSSEYQGKVGERADFSLCVSEIKPLPQDFGNPRNLIVFQDDTGNVFTWFTGPVPDWAEIGSTHGVTAKVKNHRDFQGVKQTVLSHVREK